MHALRTFPLKAWLSSSAKRNEQGHHLQACDISEVAVATDAGVALNDLHNPEPGAQHCGTDQQRVIFM